MPGLNQEAKLITPGGALILFCFASVFAIWYYDIDIWEHLGRMRDTIHYVTGGIL